MQHTVSGEVRGRPLFLVVVRFCCLVDVNTNNRSQNTVGRTQSFVLCTKRAETVLFMLITALFVEQPTEYLIQMYLRCSSRTKGGCYRGCEV